MAQSPESVEQIAEQLKRALESADLTEFADLLDPQVHWGPPGDPSPPCQSSKQVLAWYERTKGTGASARVSDVEVLGERILVGLVITGTTSSRERGGHSLRWQVYTVRGGRIVDIVGFDRRAEAVEHATAESPG